MPKSFKFLVSRIPSVSVNYSMNRLIKWKLQDRLDRITIYYMLSSAFETDPKAHTNNIFKFIIIIVITIRLLLLLLLLILFLFIIDIIIVSITKCLSMIGS